MSCGGRYGLATMCVGVGQGHAVLYEAWLRVEVERDRPRAGARLAREYKTGFELVGLERVTAVQLDLALDDAAAARPADAAFACVRRVGARGERRVEHGRPVDCELEGGVERPSRTIVTVEVSLLALARRPVSATGPAWKSSR
jgi:hypothetical protein